MPNRIIKESICTSENIDQLTEFQETFFYRLMVNCDDFGRFDARPKILSSRLYPLRSVPVEDVSEALVALQDADLITVYEVGGHAYLQMNTWGKHQQTRATKSKYPSPDDAKMPASDNNGYQLISDDSKCPRNRIRNRNRNRESLSLSDTHDDDDLHRIQSDHDQVIIAAEDAGFKISNDVMATLINLYAEHGMQKVLDGLKSCSEHGAPNLAYLKAVLSGKPRKAGDAKDIHGYDQRDYSGEQKKAMERMMSDTWGDEEQGVS